MNDLITEKVFLSSAAAVEAKTILRRIMNFVVNTDPKMFKA